MTKMLRVFGTMLIIFSLMGCGTKNTEEVNDNAVGTETETDVNDTTNNDSTTDANVNDESDQKLEVADDVADKIVEMEEVESANVIVTDTNAYVAVVLKEGADGSEVTEDKIADEVRSANAAFKNVYVSMNPDFVKQMNEYGTKIREDKPVEGFFEEFSDAMKRVFPDAH
ncbi:YhcN/YlaJ family sporulation lipoprotein [Sporosarcina sp. ANT_H38]